MTGPADTRWEHPPFTDRCGQRLFDAGPFGPHVTAFRAAVQHALAECVVPYLQRAETDGLFPREAIARLGSTGLIRRRWNSEPYGDPGVGVIVAQESARLGVAGLSVGLSLHLETVCSILVRFGSSPLLRTYLEGVLDGRLVGCLGASEPTGGSDLAGIHTVAHRVSGGWQVRGEKKYLSLGLVCDFALILCRMLEGAGDRGVLGLIAVPASGLRQRKRHTKTGTQILDTTWMTIDAVVPDGAVVARPGLGLMVTTWGLSHERLSIAAQAVGGCRRAIAITTAHLHRRVQFGRPLIEHQALRIRLADLSSRLLTLEYAVAAAAMGMPVTGVCGPRETAGLKVTAARFAETVMSECMHMFGGAGYLEDETPLARMWRDARLARTGGGTDEMMWELVAGGLTPDFAAYDDCVDLG
jgi:alkylation response protein AidB-like acyl-CoA dehydrogenase